jgi:hypothetical protein
MYNSTTVRVMTTNERSRVATRKSTGGKQGRHQVGTTPDLPANRASSLPPPALSSSEHALHPWPSRRLHQSRARMVTRSFAPPELLEEREPACHPPKRKEIARMSTGGPAPKEQRRVGGKRAAECQLRPPSPEPDMSLLSWNDSGDTIHLDSTPPPEI